MRPTDYKSAKRRGIVPNSNSSAIDVWNRWVRQGCGCHDITVPDKKDTDAREVLKKRSP